MSKKIIIDKNSVTTIEKISAEEIIKRYKKYLTEKQFQKLKNYTDGIL